MGVLYKKYIYKSAQNKTPHCCTNVEIEEEGRAGFACGHRREPNFEAAILAGITNKSDNAAGTSLVNGGR